MTSTADVVQHHLEALAGGDLPGVISDYASDATLFTPNVTFKGTDEIQAFFEGFVASLPEDFIANLEVDVHLSMANMVTSRGTRAMPLRSEPTRSM